MIEITIIESKDYDDFVERMKRQFINQHPPFSQAHVLMVRLMLIELLDEFRIHLRWH
jgi:hypothetical protein